MVYWAQVHFKYRFGITWKAFLSIADDYGDNATKKLFHTDNETTTHTILWHYIFLQEFINPDLSDVHLLAFNHILLLEEVSKIELQTIGLEKYAEPPIFDILEILINRGMYNSAVDAGTFMSELASFNKKVLGLKNQRVIKHGHHSLLFPKETEYIGIARIYYYDNFLRMFFASAHFDFEEHVWAGHLYRLIFELGFERKSLIIIIRKILDIGCISECVKQVYSFLKGGEEKGITKILSSFDKEHDNRWIMEMFLRTAYRERKFVEFAENKEVVYSSERF